MSNSIKLSPKYGINPTIPRCFFCGKDKPEIALLGRLPNDVEVPMHATIDYEPCDECKELMKKGITLIGVEDHAFDSRPPINVKDSNNAFYPTGSWIVLKEEAAKRILELEDNDEVLKNKKCLVDQKLLEEINSLYDNISDDSKEENRYG